MGGKEKSEIAESVSQNRLRPEHGSRSKDLLATEINHHTATDFAFLHLGKMVLMSANGRGDFRHHFAFGGKLEGFG